MVNYEQLFEEIFKTSGEFTFDKDDPEFNNKFKALYGLKSIIKPSFVRVNNKIYKISVMNNGKDFKTPVMVIELYILLN
jgi:hypothetical protein